MIDNVIFNNDSMDLDKFLKNNYDELWISIQNEGYNIDFNNFDEFYEIIDDDKVVGFIVIEKLDLINVKSIVDSYILPDWRGKGLLCENLIKLLKSTHYKILSKKPTRSFIQALLKAGLAYKLSDNFIFTWIRFEVSIADAYKNSKLKRLYKKANSETENIHYYANLFDLNINCMLFKDYQHNFSKNYDTFILIEPRKYDLKTYNCRKKLKNITANYLEDADEIYCLNSDDAVEYFKDLNEDIAEVCTVENIIGSEDKLSDGIIELLNELNLTIDDGFKIRRNILDSLENGEIEDISIKDRLNFLLSHPKFIDKKYVGKNDVVECSFCGKPRLDEEVNFCICCGHKLSVISEEIPKFKPVSSDVVNLDSGRDIEYDFNDFDVDDVKSIFHQRVNDFFQDIKEIKDKVDFLVGKDREEFMELVDNYDMDEAFELLDKKADSLNADWYFKEGHNVDNELLKLIDANGYDEKEVYDTQSQIVLYELLNFVDKNITPRNIDHVNAHHIDFDVVTYAITDGYINELFENEFESYLNNYSLEDLSEELKALYLNPKQSKKEVINQFCDVWNALLEVTDKGREFLKKYSYYGFFIKYLNNFIFYEFEKLCAERKNDYTLEEIANEFVNNEFKRAIKNGKFNVYLNVLEYNYLINRDNQNYDEALYCLIQRVIYEINVWFLSESKNIIELIISFETSQLFEEFSMLDADYDFDEIYNRAFHEFKFGHMKSNKDECYTACKRLLNNDYVMDVNLELSIDFHENME